MRRGRPPVSKKKKRSLGATNASRSSSKSAGKQSEPQKGTQEKMVLIDERGSAIGVTAVEVNITFCPNVRRNRRPKPRPHCPLRLPIRGRHFPPSPWRIRPRAINRRNIRSQPRRKWIAPFLCAKWKCGYFGHWGRGQSGVLPMVAAPQ